MWYMCYGILYYLGSHDMLHDMLHGMAWRAWRGKCYGLTGIWYGLADMAWRRL